MRNTKMNNVIRNQYKLIEELQNKAYKYPELEKIIKELELSNFEIEEILHKVLWEL